MARSPDTMRCGSSKMRAAEGAGKSGAGAAGAGSGGFCCAAKGEPKLLAMRQVAKKNSRRAAMVGIVVENFAERKGVCEGKK